MFLHRWHFNIIIYYKIKEAAEHNGSGKGFAYE